MIEAPSQVSTARGPFYRLRGQGPLPCLSVQATHSVNRCKPTLGNDSSKRRVETWRLEKSIASKKSHPGERASSHGVTPSSHKLLELITTGGSFTSFFNKTSFPAPEPETHVIT